MVSLLWVGFITILFSLPLFKAGLPWDKDFSWSLTNYTVLWFAAIGLCFGGWWVLSAKNWFKGPVRMGSDEELDRSRNRSRAGTRHVALALTGSNEGRREAPLGI